MANRITNSTLETLSAWESMLSRGEDYVGLRFYGPEFPRATVWCDVPVGTLVCTMSRDRYRGSGGRCSYSFGIVVPSDKDPAKGAVLDVPHRALRSRPVYVIALPDGTEAEWVRRVGS